MFIILRCRNGVTTIKDWYGVSKCVENSTFADLYNDFIGGTFDKKPSLKADFPNIVHAFVGKNKTELTHIAPDVLVGQAVGCLGNFIDFSIGDTPETA